MSQWRYTDATNSVAFRLLENGGMESVLATALPEGVTVIPYVQLLEDRIAEFESALDAHLDAKAQERRYENRISCALRAGYTGPFQAEGIAFASWMDDCNTLAYQLLAEVMGGQRPMPTDPQALIDLLPAMEWPA